MGFVAYICVMMAIGVLLGISVHLHWQGIRQLMPATGGIALLAAYVFVISSNSGLVIGISLLAAILSGLILGGLLVLVAHGISRAEFMLLGLALMEIIRHAAYELESITGGTNGLNLMGVSEVTRGIAAVVATGFALLSLCIVSATWRHSSGLALRLAGSSPRGASWFGINIRKLEFISGVLAGVIAAIAGIFYVLTIRYIHPNDLGMALGLPALAIGLAVRPRLLIPDVVVLSFVLFGLREILRFVGTGTARFAIHDLLIGIFLVAIAVHLGRYSEKEDENRWEQT
jgi:ABC-type branched-subunit amino acid transport system permease subunit